MDNFLVQIKSLKTIDLCVCRTQTSGIHPEDIEKGDNFEKVKKEVSEMVKNKIVVGHSIQFDLASLKIVPSELNLEIRDTAAYPPLHREGKINGLKAQ